jgi:hypothetical protein
VTYESRRICNCCRLAKCFRVGMDKSLIQTEAEREERKQLVQHNREKRKQLKILQSLDLVGNISRRKRSKIIPEKRPI